VLCLKKCRFIKVIRVILFITVITGIFAGFFWWKWATSPLNFNFSSKKTFVIKRGEKLTSIAQRLKKEELIRDPLAFKIVVYTQGLRGKIQAGSFHLSSSWNLYEIARTLTLGTEDIWLTFPEGWRKEEFARRLAVNLENFNVQEFLVLTKDLEGYLFPDTYLIPKSASPSAIVKILTNNFEKKTKDLNISYQDLILASIVEREAKYEDDRPVVAGILIKRLNTGWPLQVDAAIQYGVTNKRFNNLTIEQLKDFDWWPQITKDDLEIDSPYNTYKYKGVPPTPICNPGLATIRAVLKPLATDYWFYLSDKQGKIHFAKTLEEHQENIIKYLK
jgi:UPF0755 protein